MVVMQFFLDWEERRQRIYGFPYRYLYHSNHRLTRWILIFLIAPSVSSEKVMSGSNITACSMVCHSNEVLFLYKVCGFNQTLLVEHWCDGNLRSNSSEPRFYWGTNSSCWNLIDARKNDSCNYITVYYNNYNGTRSNSTLSVTVLDPITNITSNSSRPGEDIATPEITGSGLLWYIVGTVIGVFWIIVIVVLVMYLKKKSKTAERNGVDDHSEERGRLSSSSPESGRLGAEEERTGQNKVNAIRRICSKAWKNPEYKEIPQVEMEERRLQMTSP